MSDILSQPHTASRRRPLAGRVVLITGASGGLGTAIAHDLASKGARLILSARRADLLESLATELRALDTVVEVLPADVVSRVEVTSLAERAQQIWGQVDILVNNAGIGSGRTLPREDVEAALTVLDVNLNSAVLLTRLLVPGMLDRGYGRIINIASVAGHIAMDPLYSATKFGLRGFTIALWRQLRGTGVYACTVSPGFIRTPMTARLRVPMPGPEIIGRAVGSLAVRPRREVVLPRFYRAAIVLSVLFPWVTDRATGGAERKLRQREARKVGQAQA